MVDRRRALTQQDLEWIDLSIEDGYKVLGWYLNSDELNIENLDRAFDVWRKDNSENKAPDSIIANGLGVLFGKLIIEKKRAKWDIVIDNHGENLTIVSDLGAKIFPIGEMWSRIMESDSYKEGFLKEIWSTDVTLKY